MTGYYSGTKEFVQEVAKRHSSIMRYMKMGLKDIDAAYVQKFWGPHLNKISPGVVSQWQCSADTKWFLSNVGIQTHIGVIADGWAHYTFPRRVTVNGTSYISIGKKDAMNVIFAIQETSDVVTMLDLDGKYPHGMINSTMFHFMKFVTASRMIFDTVDDVDKSEAFVELRRNMQLCDPLAFEGDFSMWFWVVEEWINAYYDPLG